MGNVRPAERPALTLGNSGPHFLHEGLKLRRNNPGMRYAPNLMIQSLMRPVGRSLVTGPCWRSVLQISGAGTATNVDQTDPFLVCSLDRASPKCGDFRHRSTEKLLAGHATHPCDTH